MTQKELEMALRLEELLAKAEGKLYFGVDIEDDDLYQQLAEANTKLAEGLEKTKGLIADFKEANRKCLTQY